ncbi:Hypothetical predicted protein [Olea europaea subsp. europaea]|uniref:Uncharacterized protein n=1 Tax=Olea europaea subsp. europaea TaxID=158383 RepID=A0A8S0PWP5_OLEEU|nr:Hypothetical predicted protein [Olea europaea subsp. europaea]
MPPPPSPFQISIPTPVCEDPSSLLVQSLKSTIPLPSVKRPYPILAPPPRLTFESHISLLVPTLPLFPPPHPQVPHPYPTLVPPPTFKSPISPLIPAPPLSPPPCPWASPPAPAIPSSKKPNTHPSPTIKTTLSPPAPKL